MVFNFKKQNFWLAGAIMPVMGVVLLAGCGGGGSGPASNTGTPASSTGTLRVALVDAPAPNVSAVNITVDRVEAHINSDWVSVSTVPVTVNLLDLVRNEVLLGSANLPAGRYNQVRFFPTSATVTDDTGTFPVTIPGADQTGIKVNVNYDITPNQITTVLLDFNVGKSLRKLGNGRYQLQPVIPAVVKVLSGAITGNVTDAAAPLAGADVRAVYVAGSNYAAGTEVNTSFTLADGTFKVWALLPGTYRLEVSLSDTAANVLKTAVVENVTVSADQNTDVGAVAVQ